MSSLNPVNKNSFGFFPVLCEAVQSGKADIVKVLIRYGANVEGHHTWSGWNSLHQASLEVTCRCIVQFPCNCCILSDNLSMFLLCMR